MSAWVHAVCDSCWKASDSREPHRVVKIVPENCCFCGEETRSGIYVRLDPANPKLRCQGEHAVAAAC